ncbi:uncharacterized protein LOC117340850 [Pecten maximus]|uniref:uncharacterized protein LOC117340850 n=1 Tax=Pecten maximus TaxID=6579 RepID=UPI0014584164|nr:uncharacterized protein LOC117340850 [Pecten maximus]
MADKLTLEVDSKVADEIIKEIKTGEMEVPVGPISNLVPPKYHTHLHKRILNSLIVASEKSAKRLREIAVNVPVIVQEKTTEVYSHVLQNLTSLGQQAVAQINVLIDWDNFDKVICISPLPGITRFLDSKCTSSMQWDEILLCANVYRYIYVYWVLTIQ